MKTYEAMFLLDAGQPNFEEAAAPIRSILDRSGAEVIQLKKWDERRLAYEIKGRRRGLYVLVYFRVDPLKVTEIEHDIRLNEKVLRAMILSGEGLTAEKMAAPTPAEVEPSRGEPTEGEAPAVRVEAAEVDVLVEEVPAELADKIDEE